MTIFSFPLMQKYQVKHLRLWWYSDEPARDIRA
jgi:hypothetical protein